ncbi:MAG: TlpA family protein disulfide reductase [Bacteroidales bacterium]|nr:TlpA family protein disulfide reductase [Bacteroidales bacterium]
MKRFFYSMLLTAMSATMLVSCGGGKSNTFKIDGTCGGGITDSAYIVHLIDPISMVANQNADTICVKDGKFAYQNDTLKNPAIIFLQAIFPGGSVFQGYADILALPGETAKMEINNGWYVLAGNGIYDQWGDFDKVLTEKEWALNDLQQKLQNCQSQEEFDAVYPEYYSKVIESKNFPYTYMRQNPDKAEGILAFMLTRRRYPLTDSLTGVPEKVLNGVLKPLIDNQIKQEADQKKARAEAEARDKAAQEATAEGKMFVDFEAEYDGKVQKLSDYVGKGKYVLVDFWASWCGPCRQEIPNIIDVYNKYKGDKFDVIGVAVGDDPADTKQAIAEDNIPYNQILNTGDIAATVYGIRGIPHIILFGPDGTILARDLRGGMIEDAVKKALGK